MVPPSSERDTVYRSDPSPGPRRRWRERANHAISTTASTHSLGDTTVQVAPASVDLHTWPESHDPFSWPESLDANRVEGLLGSTTTPPQPSAGAFPRRTRLQVFPPSVDLREGQGHHLTWRKQCRDYRATPEPARARPKNRCRAPSTVETKPVPASGVQFFPRRWCGTARPRSRRTGLTGRRAQGLPSPDQAGSCSNGRRRHRT